MQFSQNFFSLVLFLLYINENLLYKYIIAFFPQIFKKNITKLFEISYKYIIFDSSFFSFLPSIVLGAFFLNLFTIDLPLKTHLKMKPNIHGCFQNGFQLTPLFGPLSVFFRLLGLAQAALMQLSSLSSWSFFLI